MGSVALEGFGSGGAALNFKVVLGLTQPGTASENTIWIKTEKIGVWSFSANQPEEMQEWDVWFQTGTESEVEFNALKKHCIQVYPISAKQYVSGTWVEVTAKSYQNGEWVEWICYLFNYGKQQYTWSPSTMKRSNASSDGPVAPTVTTNSDGSVLVTFSGNSGKSVSTGLYASDDAIDLSRFTALKLSCKNSSGDVCFTIFPENATYWGADAAYGGQSVSYTVMESSPEEFMVDVSGLSGAYRCGFGTRFTSSQTKTLLLKSIEGVR